MRGTSGSIRVCRRRAALAVTTSLLALGFIGETAAEAATEGGGCSGQVVPLYLDGTSSEFIADESLRAELGDYLKSCTYTLATDALEEALGDCVVTSATFEGSEPAPRLVSIVKGWDQIAEQAEVIQADSELAWSWTGDGLNCDESGCLDGETIQIHLLGSGFGLTEGVENCPWTRVQARFELEHAP